MKENTDSPAADGLNGRYRLAQRIAVDAGAMALEMFRQREQLVVEYKGLQDMVSAADRDVESYIRRRVRESFPDDGFLGEEGGTDQGGSDFIWVVDPIDGTACFVNGMFSWCISIAVVRCGEPMIGVVYDPNAEELFHAHSGGGAYCWDKPLRVHSGTSLKDGVLGVGTSFRVPVEAFVPFLESVLRDGGMFIRNGSGALMITYVAAGRLIGYYEPHMNSWDALAGYVLVQEAGGICNPFMENDGLRRGNPVLVANRDVYPQLARHAAMLETIEAGST